VIVDTMLMKPLRPWLDHVRSRMTSIEGGLLLKVNLREREAREVSTSICIVSRSCKVSSRLSRYALHAALDCTPFSILRHFPPLSDKPHKLEMRSEGDSRCSFVSQFTTTSPAFLRRFHSLRVGRCWWTFLFLLVRSWSFAHADMIYIYICWSRVYR